LCIEPTWRELDNQRRDRQRRDWFGGICWGTEGLREPARGGGAPLVPPGGAVVLPRARLVARRTFLTDPRKVGREGVQPLAAKEASDWEEEKAAGWIPPPPTIEPFRIPCSGGGRSEEGDSGTGGKAAGWQSPSSRAGGVEWLGSADDGTAEGPLIPLFFCINPNTKKNPRHSMVKKHVIFDQPFLLGGAMGSPKKAAEYRVMCSKQA